MRIRMTTLTTGAAALLILAGCADPTARGPGAADGATAARQTAPVVNADYTTFTDHFAALQRAGLGADYAGFAGHLKDAAPQTLIADLQANFAGAPFDLYTQKSKTSATQHRRVLELRGPRGRLYMFLELDKVTGGWNVAKCSIDRDRNTIVARL